MEIEFDKLVQYPFSINTAGSSGNEKTYFAEQLCESVSQ